MKTFNKVSLLLSLAICNAGFAAESKSKLSKIFDAKITRDGGKTEIKIMPTVIGIAELYLAYTQFAQVDSKWYNTCPNLVAGLLLTYFGIKTLSSAVDSKE